MSTEVPASIEKLLWDADLRSLNSDEHQELIIERVLNYGTLADWRWLVKRYGTPRVRATLTKHSAFSRNTVRSEAQKLASLIIQ